MNANSPFKDAYKSDAPNFIPESTNKHTELSPSPERPKAKAPSMISNKNRTTAPNSQNSNSLFFDGLILDSKIDGKMAYFQSRFKLFVTFLLE